MKNLLLTLLLVGSSTTTHAKNYIHMQIGRVNAQPVTVFSNCDNDNKRALDWNEKVQALKIFDQPAAQESMSFGTPKECLDFLFATIKKFNPQTIPSVSFGGKYSRRGGVVRNPMTTYRADAAIK